MAQTEARPKGSPAHGRATLVVVIFVIGVVITAVSGCGNSSGSSQTPRQAARVYIRQMHRDTHAVQVMVQSVQAGIVLLRNSPSAIDQFAQLAQQAHDSIDNVREDFATTDISGNLGDAEVEVFSAANDLKNAMGAVVAYAGNPNAASLAHFTSQYQNAVGEWNQGIRAIWRIAGERHAPTV